MKYGALNFIHGNHFTPLVTAVKKVGRSRVNQAQKSHLMNDLKRGPAEGFRGKREQLDHNDPVPAILNKINRVDPLPNDFAGLSAGLFKKRRVYCFNFAVESFFLTIPVKAL